MKVDRIVVQIVGREDECRKERERNRSWELLEMIGLV